MKQLGNFCIHGIPLFGIRQQTLRFWQLGKNNYLVIAHALCVWRVWPLHFEIIYVSCPILFRIGWLYRGMRNRLKHHISSENDKLERGIPNVQHCLLSAEPRQRRNVSTFSQEPNTLHLQNRHVSPSNKVHGALEGVRGMGRLLGLFPLAHSVDPAT